MSDTPTTDAAKFETLFGDDNDGYSWGEAVPADFARKLERERDKAVAARKASAADWLKQVEQANARVSRALQQVALVERERDGAREKLSHAQALLAEMQDALKLAVKQLLGKRDA